MKIYLAQVLDEWQNITLTGFFKDLKVAEEVIKESYSHLVWYLTQKL